MPHFRAQMNCVPGMKTEFHFTPTITTAEMREKTKNPDFDYVLLCNKICGATHWNMQMKIVVDSESDYQKWLADQKTFKDKSMAQSNVETKVAIN
jgi:cytochrome c oxidase subunit 2